MKKEQEKLNNMRIEQENIKRDENYVKTLANWDKNFLPKLK
jgi:hypothetical protein